VTALDSRMRFVRAAAARGSRRRRVEVLAAVVLADAEGIETDLIGVLDLLNEVLQAFRRSDG